MNKRLLLISSSRYKHGEALAHAGAQIDEILNGINSVLFIPYARPGGMTHEAYTAWIRPAFARHGKTVQGIEEFDDPVEAVAEAGSIFIGGGNTFLLVHDLYYFGLLDAISDRVDEGMPYMGASAGSNVAGLSMGTSNDMPIIHPPSFTTLGLVPFNINPHFPAHAPDKDHMGETREDRIHEFHNLNTQPVLGIREDGMVYQNHGKINLVGSYNAVLFEQGKPDRELVPGTDLSFLV